MTRMRSILITQALRRLSDEAILPAFSAPHLSCLSLPATPPYMCRQGVTYAFSREVYMLLEEVLSAEQGYMPTSAMSLPEHGVHVT